MRNARWNGLLAAAAAGLLAIAPLSAASAQSAQNVVRPGLGEDPGPPDVTPFALPEGVRVMGVIRGADEYRGECENASTDSSGTGAYVRICVPIENLSGTPVQIEFPAGLIVVATSEGRAQNGLLIERTLVTVPPTPQGGAGCRRPEDDRRSRLRQDQKPDPCAYVVPLYLYCLNEERDPSNPYITYAFAGVTRDDGLQELLRLLEGRAVKSSEDVATVQNALYSITEGRGLTREDRPAIARLPKT